MVLSTVRSALKERTLYLRLMIFKFTRYLVLKTNRNDDDFDSQFS
jgi:hypothetical protein